MLNWNLTCKLSLRFEHPTAKGVALMTKQNSGGEAKKHAKDRTDMEAQQDEIDIAEGHDHKKGNIGPSGQGSHRGRESRNQQTKASGRPDVSSAGGHQNQNRQ
jgi:hypothetical protein